MLQQKGDESKAKIYETKLSWETIRTATLIGTVVTLWGGLPIGGILATGKLIYTAWKNHKIKKWTGAQGLPAEINEVASKVKEDLNKTPFYWRTLCTNSSLEDIPQMQTKRGRDRLQEEGLALAKALQQNPPTGLARFLSEKERDDALANLEKIPERIASYRRYQGLAQ